MGQKRAKSYIELHIQGNNLIIYEFYSHGAIEQLVEQAEKECGVIFDQKCRSRCG